jgi:hypothetical protein
MPSNRNTQAKLYKAITSRYERLISLSRHKVFLAVFRRFKDQPGQHLYVIKCKVQKPKKRKRSCIKNKIKFFTNRKKFSKLKIL